jgi:F420-dependent oxidoreductase-like protein
VLDCDPELKLGLQIRYFDWPGGTPAIGKTMADIARCAEDAGYDSIWVFDHFFQIPHVGAAERPMLEAFTNLGFIAGVTNRMKIGVLVACPTHRHPGVLVKQVTTLDVLSGGRACLGLGAGWYEREQVGLGIPFPPLAERFERLEETLQIAKLMWRGSREPFIGKHYQLAEPLNSPQCLSQPHPPIVVGGGGERKTLRLTARYADASNFFSDDLEAFGRKLDVLKGHCEEIGRDYSEIEKTAHVRLDVGADGSNVGRIVERLGLLAEMGVEHAIGGVADLETLKPIEIVGHDLIPQVRDL